MAVPAPSSPPPHTGRTLWLVGLLHAFNHLYNVALLPVYLQIQRDLGLRSAAEATSLTTAMMLAYFVPSYPLGMLADRMDRKRLLGIGLALNALGFVGLGFAPNYATSLCCVLLAGVGGSFYHPAATSMVVGLFPVNPGRALGWIGIGASAGFCVGPTYVGWRAEAAGWRAPMLELGVAGLVAAGVFAWLAERSAEPRAQTITRLTPLFPSPAAWAWFLAAALFITFRDFAGCGVASLSSLFLQHGHSFSVQATGVALSAIFLVGIVSNPLFGHLSDRARLRWLALVLSVSAVMVALFPRWPKAGLLPALLAYGFFFLANFPMVEAALMTSVPREVRGRVFGLFITIVGLTGNLGHWWAGARVKALGEGAGRAENYHDAYLMLAILMAVSLAALPCFRALRRREGLAVAEATPALAATPELPRLPENR